MKKKGVSQLIAVILLIAFVIVISIVIFTFTSKTATTETSKSADKATAQEICREDVKIRINSVDPDSLNMEVENFKAQAITDFILRMEKGNQIDIIKKGGQTLGGYEKITLTGIEKKFNPNVIKLIPQITLQSPKLTSMSEGWWLCSDQMAVYNL